MTEESRLEALEAKVDRLTTDMIERQRLVRGLAIPGASRRETSSMEKEASVPRPGSSSRIAQYGRRVPVGQ